VSTPRRTPQTPEALRAELVEHARRLVEREGTAALTMRRLADEAGCAVGLPYKVFADRRELVVELVQAEFSGLRGDLDELAGRAGTGTVSGNLGWFAERLLGSPSVALAQEVLADDSLPRAMRSRVEDAGLGPVAFERGFARYLAAEKRAGRVDPGVDEDAFGFLLAGALHNLVVAGEPYPRPSGGRLQDFLTSVADRLRPATPPTSP
jgi:AcrR family transcriptional regulator